MEDAENNVGDSVGVSFEDRGVCFVGGAGLLAVVDFVVCEGRE